MQKAPRQVVSNRPGGDTKVAPGIDQIEQSRRTQNDGPARRSAPPRRAPPPAALAPAAIGVAAAFVGLMGELQLLKDRCAKNSTPPMPKLTTGSTPQALVHKPEAPRCYVTGGW
jgi:hypothetical protein